MRSDTDWKKKIINILIFMKYLSERQKRFTKGIMLHINIQLLYCSIFYLKTFIDIRCKGKKCKISAH